MKTQICKMKDFTGKVKYYISIEDFAERRCTLIISEREYNKANPKNQITQEELIEGNDKFKEGIS